MTAVACDGLASGRRDFSFERTSAVSVGDSLGYVRFVGTAHAEGSAYVITSAAQGNILVVSSDKEFPRVILSDSVIRAFAVGSVGSRVWVSDDAARRVIFFRTDSAGSSWLPVPTIHPHGQPRVVGVLETETVFVEEWPPDANGDTLVKPLVRVGRDSTVIVDSLLEIGGIIDLSGTNGSARLRQPWQYSDLAVMAANNSSLLILRQRPPSLGSLEVTVTVEELGDSGLPVSAPWKMVFPAVQIADSHVSGWLQSMIRDSAFAELLGGRERATATLAGMLFRPTSIPPVQRVIAMPRNALLVERTPMADSVRRWELWTRQGLQGVMTVPQGLEIRAVADTTVWAVERKSRNNVERVVRGYFRPTVR